MVIRSINNFIKNMPNDFEKFGDITPIQYKKVMNYKKKVFFDDSNENNVRLKGGEAPRQNILNRL